MFKIIKNFSYFKIYLLKLSCYKNYYINIIIIEKNLKHFKWKHNPTLKKNCIKNLKKKKEEK